MKRKNISDNAIRRLPRYLRKLDALIGNDEERVSSSEISRQLGLTPSLIRQDFSSFGEFGHQGYGYNIRFLSHEIAQVLGIYHGYTAILVGPGHIGTAFAENLGLLSGGTTYKANECDASETPGLPFNDSSRGAITLLGVFDIRPEMIGGTVGGYPVYDVAAMDEFVKHHMVDIAILSVPRETAQELTDVLIRSGIRGIWNFTNTDLDVGDSGTLVENIHFSDSLQILTYRLNARDTGEHPPQELFAPDGFSDASGG